MKRIIGLFAFALLAGCGDSSNDKGFTQVEPQPEETPEAEVYASQVVQKSSDWVMVWEDEFYGTEIDRNKWGYEINCWGGGNEEQQCYTDRPENSYVEQGILVIKAIKGDFIGPAEQDDSPNYNPNVTRTLPYSSARLRSKNKGDWKYGRFEVRAKLPYGQGTWPAIWMLPTDWVYGPWAGSGEIDIMEAVNLRAASDEIGYKGNPEIRVHGTLHYGSSWPGNVYTGAGFRLPNDEDPSVDFHVYALEWEKDEIRWYVDDVHYATQRSETWFNSYKDSDGNTVQGEEDAPFNQKFHLLLNLAVGGSWAANTNDKGIDESVYPQSFEIDYVRVYKCSVDTETGQGCAAISEEAKIVTD